MAAVVHRLCLAWAVAVAVAARPAAAQATRPPTAPAAPRPNIVLVLADDLGYSDLGCYGGEIATPNLDRLGRDGVRLAEFYNQARCCPSRATLMTGRWPHEVGIGAMIDGYHAPERAAAHSPAYADHLATGVPTIPELLRAAGYRTLMSGKWHLGKDPDHWPVRYGFDRSFVQVDGAMNYFGGPTGDGPREPMALDDRPFVPPHDGFYTTDAFTDRAIEFVDQAHGSDPARPFFLYLAYNAPHWPLQAPDADTAKYAGKYDRGWQPTRVDRLRRQVELGLFPPGSPMAPMDRGLVRPWNQLGDDQRREWARRMEVYAAQVDHLDRAVGRLLAELDRLGVADNTLVLFASDNGGAAEDPNRGTGPIGTRDSYRGYARPWATVSNTPWRLHKVTCYEGGISTPLVVRWPAGIPAGKVGRWVRGPAHLVDLLPTFADLAGAAVPANLDGRPITAILRGDDGPTDRTFYWEHQDNRGVRSGRWMLVALGDGAGPRHPFELYDLSVDRVQAHDVSADHPDVVRQLERMYADWARRAGVIPWPVLVAKSQGRPVPADVTDDR